MSDKKNIIIRPLPVSIASVVMLVLGVFNVIYSFTGVYAPFGVLYTAFHTILTVVMFAGISGIWTMERWGVRVFLVVMALKFALDIYSGAFSYFIFLLLIPGFIFLYFYKKMK